VINIIGLGAGDLSTLSEEARDRIRNCGLIIGSKRQRELVAELIIKDTLLLDYPSPISQLKALLENHNGKTITILASGDPLYFGIGAWLSQNIKPSRLHFFPNTSSIQIAFSRIKQPWQDVKVISLHGRPLISIRPHLRNHRWYGIFTDENSQPQHIAKELLKQGFEQSKLWVCETLGTETEKIRHFSVDDLLSNTTTFQPLHITIVLTRAAGGILPEFPGIADELFETGDVAGRGLITKKQVRLAALTLLQTQANEVCWDVGAGCGGLSVEWAFWHPHNDIYAIEDNKYRLEYLKMNQKKFGVVRNLHIFSGTAPYSVFDGVPAPDKVFIGGSGKGDALLHILNACWEGYLKPSGCIVVSCVTETSKYFVMKFIENHDLYEQVEKVEISSSIAVTLADKELLRPQLPVQLIKITKKVVE